MRMHLADIQAMAAECSGFARTFSCFLKMSSIANEEIS